MDATELLYELLSLQMMNKKLCKKYPEDFTDLTRCTNIETLIRLLENTLSGRAYPVPNPCGELQDSHTSDKESECVFCLESFSIEGAVKRLQCGHIFHPECLNTWLQDNNTCPICRAPVTPWDQLKNQLHQAYGRVSVLLLSFVHIGINRVPRP